MIQSDVLKVAHHGRGDSTTLDFPAAVVISAGEENPYDHPSPQLLERLRQSWRSHIAYGRQWRNSHPYGRKRIGSILFRWVLGALAQVNSPKVQPPQNQENAQQQ